MATNARDGRSVCLVTIHGIGFEQRPTPGIPMSGYADMLHARLSAALASGDGPSLLSDDPRTQRETALAGQAGPVYVESSWPVDSDQREAGLKRLGVWRNTGARAVGAVTATKEARLVEPGRSIAHVALVYSRLEDQVSHLGAAVETLARATVSLPRYESPFAAIHMAVADSLAALEPPPHTAQPQALAGGVPTSLRVRGDARRPHHRFGLRPAATLPESAPPPSDRSGDILLQLQADVATYVCRDDLRQRVRGFVRDALLRLIYRKDVAGIVINAHSQGTVVAFDVLSQLSPFEARKVWWLVTMGSPLRKYADLFCWEREIGALREIGLREAPGRNAAGEEVLPLRWTNFWDPLDPVADPLRPATREGQPPATYTDDETLYQWIDPMTGASYPVAIDDRRVDNVAHSSGGLRAHNYWDNDPDVIQPLAEGLRALVRERLRIDAAHA
jgi:hypothetical protein